LVNRLPNYIEQGWLQFIHEAESFLFEFLLLLRKRSQEGLKLVQRSDHERGEQDGPVVEKSLAVIFQQVSQSQVGVDLNLLVRVLLSFMVQSLGTLRLDEV